MYASKIDKPQRLDFKLAGPDIWKARGYIIERYPPNKYRGERFIARDTKGKLLGMRVTKDECIVLCEISSGYL